MKKLFIFSMVCCLLVGCFPTAMADSAFSAALDMTKWQYNASDDVYWQVGIQYCSEPADLTYETLQVYVPSPLPIAFMYAPGTKTPSVSYVRLASPKQY